jgi:hypothetical protein
MRVQPSAPDDPRQRDAEVRTPQQRQEDVSKAYLRAVVAMSGMTCDFRESDTGIDASIFHIVKFNGRITETGVKLYVQLKSSIVAEVRDTCVSYEMEVKTYTTLTMVRPLRASPRILVLLALPQAEGEWFDQDEERLIMRKCAYWFSLRDCKPTENLKSIMIDIPRKNLFNVDNLRAIMDRVYQGGEP